MVDVLEGNLPLRHVPASHVDADVGAALLDVGQDHAAQLESAAHGDRARVEENVLAALIVRALVQRHLGGEVEGVGRHAVFVVELGGQPLARGECLETEAVGVFGELVLRADRVERGLEVLDEVEAAGARAIQVGGVGGFPAGREDRVDVIADADSRIVQGVGRLEVGIVAGAIDHVAHAVGVDGNRLGPVEENLDPVAGGLQVGQETEDVLVSAGGLPGGRHDPRRHVRALAHGARILLPVRLAHPVEGGGVSKLDEHPKRVLSLAFALTGVSNLIAQPLQETGCRHATPVSFEVGGTLRELTHQRIRLCHVRQFSA